MQIPALFRVQVLDFTLKAFKSKACLLPWCQFGCSRLWQLDICLPAEPQDNYAWIWHWTSGAESICSHVPALLLICQLAWWTACTRLCKVKAVHHSCAVWQPYYRCIKHQVLCLLFLQKAMDSHNLFIPMISHDDVNFFICCFSSDLDPFWSQSKDQGTKVISHCKIIKPHSRFRLFFVF